MEADVNYDSICIPSKDIIACEIENKVILVPLVAGICDFGNQICTLSKTGWAIWQKLNEEQTLGQVTKSLSEEFTSPVDEIGKDVLGFAAEMVRYGTCILLKNERLKQHNSRGAEDKNSERNHDNQGLAQVQLVEEPLPSYIIHGGELHLSNLNQLELLCNMKDRGISLRAIVSGLSMHPFIRNQDVLTIVPLGNNQTGVGKVVAFSHPDHGRLAIHRIIKRTGSGWLIKGDNCPKADGIVSTDNIIGLVTRIERNGKNVRLGLGIECKWIAILNRGKGLFFIKLFWHLPRRAVGYILLKVQSISAYRKLGRSLVPPVIATLAEKSDLEAVHRYFNPSMPYGKQTLAQNVTNLVAKQKGKLIGVATLVYYPENHFPWVGYWLFSLHVKSRYRGFGFGEKLVRLCIEEAKKRGASELFLLVNEDNRIAIQLNHKLGFKVVIINELESLLSEMMHQFGLKRIVMRKILR